MCLVHGEEANMVGVTGEGTGSSMTLKQWKHILDLLGSAKSPGWLLGHMEREDLSREKECVSEKERESLCVCVCVCLTCRLSAAYMYQLLGPYGLYRCCMYWMAAALNTQSVGFICISNIPFGHMHLWCARVKHIERGAVVKQKIYIYIYIWENSDFVPSHPSVYRNIFFYLFSSQPNSKYIQVIGSPPRGVFEFCTRSPKWVGISRSGAYLFHRSETAAC